MKRSEQIGRRNGRRISKLIAEVVEACRAEGTDRMNLFFEPESAAIFVMDSDHPRDGDAGATPATRQEAIVGRIPVVVSGIPFSAGAW